MISNIYHLVIYQPLYNGLVFLTNIVPFHDLGLAIIVLTLVVRLILWPLMHRSIVTQRKMKEIEPEISKIKEKFKKNKEEQAKQTMALYRSHGISPFSGFFLLLVQLPILIALFKLLLNGVDFNSEHLYSFVHLPQEIKTMFLGLIDMSKRSYLIAVLAGVSQFFQIRLSMPKIKKKQSAGRSFKDDLQRSMSLQMKYIMPVFIFFIALRFSSGLALYWTTSNVFAILHEIIVARKSKKTNERTSSISKRDNRESFGQAHC